MLYASIVYVSCLFWRGFNGIISIEDCVVFNDRVTDKSKRIWKELVVLSRYCASICLEGLGKTIKTLSLFTGASGDSRNSFEYKFRALLMRHTSECMCWEICREMYNDNIKMNTCVM